MTKNKKSFKYICPSCKKEQSTTIQWQIVSVAWEFDLKTGESEEIDKTGGDHEAWACPGCGEDLPEAVCEKIEKELGW